jgi:hypothetical protein
MFMVGDVCEAYGLSGIVESIDTYVWARLTDESRRDEKRLVSFLKDGTFQPWHKEPSLKFISRPKKKQKVRYYPI